jgi:very-short-patch-repair endonuclease
MYPDTQHGFSADWCKNPQTGRYLPFDILLKTNKIIVEVDGMQHFEVVKQWKSCPEEQLQRDTYKAIKALKHGYSMVRICQRSVCSSWDWVAALEAAINDCLSNDKHIVVYVAEDLAQYDGHQVSITEDALQDINIDDLELLSGMSDTNTNTSNEDADAESKPT